MLTALVVVIFISFIGVGLPDSVLGTAWPAIYREFDLPISLAGYISSSVCIGTITSSLLSAKMINRFGAGMVTAFSTLLTAIALFGFSFTQNPAFFFLLAIPLGLGAGAIDNALNGFVAMHYSASTMSFLHCFYGIGVAASPFVMSLALGEDGNWRRGYFIVACIQFAITVVSFAALPLWQKIKKQDEAKATVVKKTLSLFELVKMPTVRLSCLSFFAICGLELSAGQWSSSYFVNTRDIPADRAAQITMLFYIGLSGGRLLSGFIAGKWGRRKILRVFLVILFLSILAFLLPLPTVCTAVALFFIGFAIGPVYPNLTHLSPQIFGEDIAQSVMGAQQAMTYFGIMTMPWLFGVLSEFFTTSLLPFYLLILFALYGIVLLSLLKKIKEK